MKHVIYGEPKGELYTERYIVTGKVKDLCGFCARNPKPDVCRNCPIKTALEAREEKCLKCDGLGQIRTLETGTECPICHGTGRIFVEVKKP